MTYADAANYYKALGSRDQIMKSDDDLVTKTRELANWQHLADKKPSRGGGGKSHWTVQDLVHGVFGAGLGAGVAKGINAMLPVSERFADKVETVGMGIGAAMNTGTIKWAEDVDAEARRLNERIPKIAEQRRNAFRIGFMKAAMANGLLKKEAMVPMLSLGVGDLLSIPRSAARAFNTGAKTVGGIAGTASAPDETEEDLTKMELERMLLEEELERLRSDKRNAALRKVLANRGK
jgi:hypothetical protein